jgi:pantoate--beta-alanine ligase
VQLVQSIADLRAALRRPRDIILVPTMGNLHEGHLSLVRIARQREGLVVASIFVNPLQFAPHEDFKKYPRTLEHDCQLLAGAGCDIAFAPAVEQMYPEAQEFEVHPPAGLADILEGSVRPGFFTGVCTVVLKLFSIVGPSAAVFGKKDYQQLLMITNMVRQFALPIEIIPAETIRDASGLALSSRNGYLNEQQRIEAVQLYTNLRKIAGEVRRGCGDWRQLEDSACDLLISRGWRPDYVAIRRQTDLGHPMEREPMVVLGAAKLGGTRLIDTVDV